MILLSFNYELFNPSSRAEMLKFINDNSSWGTLISLVLLSYLVGFILSSISKVLVNIKKWLDKIIFKLKKTFYKNLKKKTEVEERVKLYRSEKIVLLRELLKENFVYYEKWNVLKTMTLNIAFIIIISIFILIYKTGWLFWKYEAMALFLAYFIVDKAQEYGTWAKIELDNAVHIFKLNENPKELLEKQKP
jgi:amino acid transporter